MQSSTRGLRNGPISYTGRLVMMLFLLSCMGSLPIHAQEKGMEEMWGDQKEIAGAKDAKRVALFNNGNYAMFIHWGTYSNIANKWKDTTYYGISEWIMHPRRANISVAEYKEHAKTFNPVNFNAKAIAQLAKDAGMKYVVITSKHHDGFAMYDSKSNDFNIAKVSKFGRDPMKELANECRALGLGFGFYYSHNQDWTFPGGNRGPKTTADGMEVDFDYYFKKKCLPQVKEITTEYGDIAMVWFDTPGDMEKKYVAELVDVVRKNQPMAMISGRAGHGLGDYKSFGDMNIPIENIEGLWETVDVTNDSWGYAWYDQNWKSPKRILKSVISTVARGGTYMLNVGPAPDGSIPMEATDALRKSGDWIEKYPQVIYSSDPSPWGRELAWGDAIVAADGKINLCIYDWPMDGKIVLPSLQNKVKKAKLLVNGKRKKVKTSQKNGWTTIYLPAKRPEKLVSVVEVEVEGTIKVNHSLTLDPSYSTNFSVAFAESKNCSIAEKRWMEKFGEWKHIEQAQDWTDASKVTWEVEIMQPGYYQIDLNYAADGKTVWRMDSDEGAIVQNQQNGSHVYKYYEMGLMKFKKAGKHKVSVSIVEGNKEKASLKEIRFTPLESLE